MYNYNFLKNHGTFFCCVFLLFFISAIFSFNIVFADIIQQGNTITTDRVNLFFKNQISLTNMTVQNDGIFMKFSDTSEERKYTFYRQTTTIPYNVNFTGLSTTRANFTVNTTGLTDVKLNVTGSQISSVLLDGTSSSSIVRDGNINTINVASAKSISIFVSTTISNALPSYTFDNNLSQITVNSSSAALSTVTVPNSVSVAQINYSPIQTTNLDATKSVSIATALTVTKQSTKNFILSFPASVKITGPSTWDGIINLPNIKSASSINAGTGRQVLTVMDMGRDNITLTFDKPVRLVFEGSANTEAGFQNGSTTSIITTTCNADNTTSVSAQLAGSGECVITSGNDLIIWTYHFTSFFTFSNNASTQSNSETVYSGGSGRVGVGPSEIGAGSSGASGTGMLGTVQGSESIPYWIKGSIIWWNEGKITDQEFQNQISYLIKVKAISIDSQDSSVKMKMPESTKQIALMWVNGKISDSNFGKIIEHHHKNGIW